VPDNPQRIDLQPESIWLLDRIVSRADGTESAFRRDGTGFRLDGKGPYLRLHFVSIYVSDQERSLHFFVDQLGFSLISDAQFASGNRWIEVAPPDGTAILALVKPIPGLNQEHFVGNSGMVTFLTEDVEAKYQEWSGRGVSFTMPPQTPAWGGTFCAFHDPDGNTFALAGFDATTRELDARRRAYADRLEAEMRTTRELEIAKQVQARLFPQRLPPAPTLDYAGLCIQARAVGGDYYDFLELGSGRLALVLADIAGKGIAASLLMANLQANLRSQCAVAADDPSRFLNSVNRLLFENTADNAFATLFFADFDPRTGRLRYANCGHLPGLVLRADGTVDRLDATCTVVGLFDHLSWSVVENRLDPGDILALFTDGVTESVNADGQEFGEAGLTDALMRHRALPAQQFTAAIVDEVTQFSTGAQFDDITLIIAKRGESGSAP
jgi:catechol 2,3-dioxygenase-like lactoylglutathione lyase family enzyme